MPKDTLAQFGQRIKAQHPEYRGVDDVELANRVLAKYPEYRDRVETSPAPMQTVVPPTAKPQGFLSSALESSGLSGLGSALLHPKDTAQAIWKATSDDAIKGAVKEKLGQIKQIGSDLGQGQLQAAAAHAIDATPILGGVMQKAASQAPAPTGSYLRDLKNIVTSPGAMGTITGASASLTPLAADGIAKLGGGQLLSDVAAKVPARLANPINSIGSLPGRMVRAPFTTAVDEPMLGTNQTPRQRFQAAQRAGVPLDLADATNSALPKAIKAVNSDSLAGAHVYEGAKAKRLDALNTTVGNLADSMSPMDREAGGAELQNLLTANKDSLLDASKAGYQKIAQQYGGLPVVAPEKLSSVGKNIIDENAQHLAEFPSLGLGKVNGVIEDAAAYGKPKPMLTGRYKGRSIYSTYSDVPPPNVGDAIKARSGILDMYQNNPELVKSSADAHLQRLVGGADDVISSTLPPEGLDTWRDANANFKEVKGTYDNPSSPYYSAVRTPTPSTLVTGFGKTPEALDDLTARVGDKGRGIVQRGVFDSLLRETPGGQAQLGRFPQRLADLPADYRAGLFQDKLPALQDVSSTAQALSKDLNASGTAKQGQKFAEAAALIPTGGLPLLQYPVAKFMNSPSVVNFMMKEPAAMNPVLGVNPKVLPFALPVLARKTGTQ